MECSDLMIGDWVFDGDEVARVTSLTCDGIIETTRRISNIEIVTPILLTPEILEKNGFKLVEGELYLPAPRYVWIEGGKRDCFIEVILYNPPIRGVEFLVRINAESTHESGINLTHSCDIEYIHQLQHALKLCKIDKEIMI